jgi:hypothetical protein
MIERIVDPRLESPCSSEPALDPQEDVVEVPLLLPGWQMSALERAAYKRGLTAGEMVRHLLRDFFSSGPAPLESEHKIKVG